MDKVKVRFLGTGAAEHQSFSVDGQSYPRDVWRSVTRQDAQRIIDAGGGPLFQFVPPLAQAVVRDKESAGPSKGRKS